MAEDQDAGPVNPPSLAGAGSEPRKPSMKNRLERAYRKGWDEAVNQTKAQMQEQIKTLTLRAETAEANHAKERKEHLTHRAQVECLRHAAELNAIDPHYVWLDVRERIQFNDDGTVVITKDGKPTTKTIKEAVQEHLADPRRVKASAHEGGSGSRGGAGANGSTQFDLKTREGRKAAIVARVAGG